MVDLMIIKHAQNVLDTFISACLDDTGNPKAPDKRSLLEARKMLPSSCKNTLKKDKK